VTRPGGRDDGVNREGGARARSGAKQRLCEAMAELGGAFVELRSARLRFPSPSWHPLARAKSPLRT
jgi:hypothetical protein